MIAQGTRPLTRAGLNFTVPIPPVAFVVIISAEPVVRVNAPLTVNVRLETAFKFQS